MRKIICSIIVFSILFSSNFVNSMSIDEGSSEDLFNSYLGVFKNSKNSLDRLDAGIRLVGYLRDGYDPGFENIKKVVKNATIEKYQTDYLFGLNYIEILIIGGYKKIFKLAKKLALAATTFSNEDIEILNATGGQIEYSSLYLKSHGIATNILKKLEKVVSA